MNNSEIAEGGAQRQTLGMPGNVIVLTTVSSRPLRSSLACSLFSFNKLINKNDDMCSKYLYEWNRAVLQTLSLLKSIFDLFHGQIIYMTF